jgi:hypothetical protein
MMSLTTPGKACFPPKSMMREAMFKGNRQ